MTTKIAVSLPDDLVAAARDAVAQGRSASVSAVVAEALRAHLVAPAVDGLDAVIADMVAEHGEPTAEDRQWAARALGLAPGGRG